MSVVLWWCRLAIFSTCTLCLVVILTQVGLNFNRTPLRFDVVDEALQNVSNRGLTDHVGRKNLTRNLVRVKILPSVNMGARKNFGLQPTKGSGVLFPMRTVAAFTNASVDHVKNSLRLSRLLALTTSTRSLRPKANVQATTVALPKVPELLWQGKEGSTYADYGEKGCTWHSAKPILKALLKRWILVAKRLKITYYITCGTLLGSYRNSALVPNDGDLDIIVDIRDYPKLKRLAQKRNFIGTEKKFHFVVQVDFEKPMDTRRRFSCGGKQVPSYMDHCSFQEPLGRLIRENYHLDVYHYMVKGDTVEDPSEGGRVLQKSDVFPLKRCMLMGVETRCPKNPKALLTMLYGNDLKPLKICKNGRWVDAEKR